MDWLNKLRCSYMIEYYIAVKENKAYFSVQSRQSNWWPNLPFSLKTTVEWDKIYEQVYSGIKQQTMQNCSSPSKEGNAQDEPAVTLASFPGVLFPQNSQQVEPKQRHPGWAGTADVIVLEIILEGSTQRMMNTYYGRHRGQL